MAGFTSAANCSPASTRARARARLAGAALLAFAVLSVTAPAHAVPAGRIEGIQMPVWVERHGAARPGWAGMRVHAGDRLRTGDGGRALLRLDEGEMTVSRGEDPPVAMRDPLTFYVAPKGAPALPVAPVEASQLAQWAAEVALTGGHGVVRRGGGWRVLLSSHRSLRAALTALARLQADGYPALLSSVEIDGQTWHRLAIGDFSGPEEARAFAKRIVERPDVVTPWIATDAP